MPSRLVGGNGTGLVYPSSGSIARVFMHVAGNVIVPSLDTIGQPAFGLTPKLDLKAGFSGAQGGVLLMSATRLPTPVPTPFGNLLIAPPFQLSLFVPTGTGQIPLTIPNDRTLADVKLQWQGAVFDVTKGLFGLSNGTQWLLGQK